MSASDSSSAELVLVDQAASYLRERGGDRLADLRIAIVLGSGLKGLAARVDDAIEIPFGDVPGWPKPKVEGHGGALVLGRLAGAAVACVSGRVHLYEGWSPNEVVRVVRTLRRLGTPRFLLTNAAGGAADGMAAGDLMVIADHLNLTGSSPLLGDHVEAFGPRFPDQSSLYSPALGDLLRECASKHGAKLGSGVYAGLLGPSYETPAEVRMCRALGADAVGMSTVHEAIALNAMGAELAGLSLITNLAAGRSAVPLSHDEVVEAGAAAAATLEAVVTDFCGRL